MVDFTEYWEHITSDGERWDTIAYQYYGDATLYEPIISANPNVSITAIIPAGLKIIVPDIAISDTDTADLPPWKQ